MGGFGCSEEEIDSGTIINPSVPDSDTPPVDSTPVGEIEETGFWVNVKSDQFDVFIDNTSSFGSDCFIDLDEPANTDMNCIVDVMEGSLYIHPIEMQYNAPPGLCDLVVVRPSWMWNQSVGVGPSRVALLESELVADEPILGDCRALNENETDGGSPAILGDTNMVTCSAHPETSNPAQITAPTCVYDKSSGGVLNNCCFGSYDLEIWEDSDNNGVADTLKSRTEDIGWGGSVSSCITPYINDGWDQFDPQGFPVSRIQAVPRDPASDNPVGLNDSVNLTSNGSSHKVFGFSTWANFYTSAGAPHTHEGYYSATVSTQPYAVEPIDDLTGSPVASGRSPWVFECRDNAYELKHRISVSIREWNTLADFFIYQTSQGVTYDPDVTGIEGTNCDYDGIFGNQDCNDLNDMDDILTNAGGTYDTNDASPGTPPNAVDALLRDSYFPNITLQ